MGLLRPAAAHRAPGMVTTAPGNHVAAPNAKILAKVSIVQPPLLSVALAAKPEMVKLVGEAQSTCLCPQMLGKWEKEYLLLLASLVWGGL